MDVDKQMLREYLLKETIEDEEKMEKLYKNLSENEKKKTLTNYMLRKKIIFSINDDIKKNQEKECIMSEIRNRLGIEELFNVKKKLLIELMN